NTVLRLVNKQQAAGKYSIEFDATNIPSGVYYYRIESGNYSDTKKMILLK
ncbi:MAG: T9SS type A sorting domain-containing protein, partial [Melioribacteraceae bacterium]|nr:T9SS type A sorting domain-containing protein [Melioribacteraceae bacterium]